MKEVRVQSQNPGVDLPHSVIPAQRRASRNPARLFATTGLTFKTIWIPAPAYYPPG
jgi:hypothetical protein